MNSHLAIYKLIFVSRTEAISRLLNDISRRGIIYLSGQIYQIKMPKLWDRFVAGTRPDLWLKHVYHWSASRC